ncbi:TPA: DUF2877 domain-containing protein [Klebsiella pneumoniae]|jgi:hypothetical protein|uniref:YahE/YlbF-like protein n=4 Tax=Pseudomonadota TaxID=1224 RepID=Q99Q25_ENTCL|nr:MULTISPECIES: DUF2877 domain-containing protein [Pseudomonadota]AAK00497.1 YahE/YlbG-like protein [Paracidovorax citrulli]AAK11693.1 YahE/YlbF-like protein [Enterobacter cloacae]ERI52403.1 hypothetical protein N878_19280 [Pseudomonas sp. EGD-AK9]HBZ7732235.1 DUF2877 domain-containing protein [Klebsiella variicola subsp. variicola]MCD6622910.1 DUF2877 domain-containing protein [Klebsiella michiganensis]
MMTLVHTGREPHTGTVAGKPLHVMAALSADMVFMRSLSSVGFGGRVHSVFKRVINIELSGGGLFTLASCDLDNAPDTIIVDSADFSEIHVAARQRVSTVGNLMHVGPFLDVRFRDVKGWSGELPRYPADASLLRRNLHALTVYLKCAADAGGMLRLLAGGSTFEHDVSAALAARSGRLCNALLRRNIDDARIHAKSMIGLGPGLTPSGDDYLVGLFAVLNVLRSPSQTLRCECLEMIVGAEFATNAISYAALSKAATGRVRAIISELIERLMHGTENDFLAPLARVLAIGSTSGSDIVAGIVSGLRLQLEFEQTVQPTAADPK